MQLSAAPPFRRMGHDRIFLLPLDKRALSKRRYRFARHRSERLETCRRLAEAGMPGGHQRYEAYRPVE